MLTSLPDGSENPLAASGRIKVIQDRSFMVVLISLVVAIEALSTDELGVVLRSL